MFSVFRAIFILLLCSGCAHDRWRAPTLETSSTSSTQLYAVDQYSSGESIKIGKFRLANGLKIIVFEDRSAPVFAYHTWLNVGSRNEREGITGIAHLFEHLMFKETKNRKEGEFDRILEEQGGHINAATYVDWTFYRESLPKGAFSLIPALEADRLQNMILSDAQVNSEREVVANERRFRTDNSPSGLMYEALYKTAFTKHSYYWPVVGWMRDIQAISADDCREFHKAYYAPNNATIVVVGDVDTAEVLKSIQEAYGEIPPSTIPKQDIPKEPPQTSERRVDLEQPIPGEKILLGFHIPDSQNPDYPVLEVAHSILFNGKSSRLYRRLITDTHLAAEAGGWVNQVKDPGLYVIDISLQPNKKSKDAETIVYEELKRLADEAVPPAELEKAKTRLETGFWENFRTADSKAELLGFHETVSGDYRKAFELVPICNRVTADDIKKVAKKYFAATNRTVVTARPKKS